MQESNNLPSSTNFNDALEGTVKFLLKRDVGNWEKLTSDEREQITKKAHIVARALLTQVIEKHPGRTFEEICASGELVQGIVDLLPMPEFTLRIIVKLG